MANALSSGRAWVAWWLLIAIGMTAWPASAADRDPIEGRWRGTIGGARERIDVGLEFRRDADGKLALRLTQPVSNYYDVDPGGDVLRDGARVTHDGLALSLTLREDDVLVGTFPGPNSSAELRRVKTLPSAPVVPRWPTGPAPRWETRIGGQVFASPVVVDGIAYIGTTGGVLNAVDTRDGRIAWTYVTGAPIHGAVAVSGDAVYVASDGGGIAKLARADGREAWRYALGDGDVPRVLPHPTVFTWDWQGATPLVVDDTVFIGDANGVFHAIDTATGARRWRFATGAKIRQGAAISGDHVIVGSEDHGVYALDRATGREAWRAQALAAIDATPVVHDGRVYIGDRGGGLYALDAKTGASQWRIYFWGSWVESTPVVHDGVLYVGSSDLRRVSAIDPVDGTVRWRTDVFGWTWGTPLVVGDRIYAGVAGGTPYFIPHVAGFVTLERATGRVLSRWPLPDTGGHQWGIAGSPVRAGDDVIVATIAGSGDGVSDALTPYPPCGGISADGGCVSKFVWGGVVLGVVVITVAIVALGERSAAPVDAVGDADGQTPVVGTATSVPEVAPRTRAPRRASPRADDVAIDLRACADASVARFRTHTFGAELSQILALPADRAWTNLVARPLDFNVLYAATLLVGECLQAMRIHEFRETTATFPADSPWQTPELRAALESDVEASTSLRAACTRGGVTIDALVALYERSSLAPGVGELLLGRSDETGQGVASDDDEPTPAEIARLRAFLDTDAPVDLGVVAATNLLDVGEDAARAALAYLERNADHSTSAAAALAECMARECAGRAPADIEEKIAWLTFGAQHGDIGPLVQALTSRRQVGEALAWQRVRRDLDASGCNDGARGAPSFLLALARQQHDQLLARATATERARADVVYRELAPVLATLRTRGFCD